MGILHNILATLAKLILFLPLFLYGSFKQFIKGTFNEYYDNLAYIKDLYGNILGQDFFNDVFLKNKDENILKYGDYRIVDKLKIFFTISHVTATNYYIKNLTKTGIFFAKFLILSKDKSFKIEDTSKPFLFKFKKLIFII